MVHYVSLLVSIIAASGLAAAGPVDTRTVKPRYAAPSAPLADGTYIVSNREDGSTAWQLIDAPKSSPRDLPASLFTKRDSEGPNCRGRTVNVNDKNAAQQQLLDLCGGAGFTWSGKSIVKASGSAIAYGCDYGGSQTCHSGDLSGFFGALDSSCGVDGAGYYAKHEWKVGYGRDVNGAGIC
ncbi:hypothetical protein BDV96DRAFT_571950 [Lophiotrema nucula]|uniref:Ecp2 effector protein domain-containing protein n=1 Tax=Lophiotrema nucula TaxID=690887 RepID=A0A6A5ZDP5_9PLEO|nr:hypothetical protein BDV96DRAFT_571950 [Lophiotrema nucula]